jgi:hypothetical protein
MHSEVSVGKSSTSDLEMHAHLLHALLVALLVPFA